MLLAARSLTRRVCPFGARTSADQVKLGVDAVVLDVSRLAAAVALGCSAREDDEQDATDLPG